MASVRPKHMEPKNQIEVVVDVSRNVLKLAFTGRIAASLMAQYEAEITRALKSLPPGFSLLVDFTELLSMNMDCVPYLDRNMDAFRDHGVGLIVRIIPDRTKDIGVGIMSLFHYPPGLRIVTTESREQAERVLS